MPGTSTSAPRGLDGVVAARTRLSHVDGDRGELIIGGYELKELAGRVSFEAAAPLLWRGALPPRDGLGRFGPPVAARARRAGASARGGAARGQRPPTASA